MLLTRLEPDHISGSDFLEGAAVPLYQAVACRDDEDLAKGMRVPCRASARLEGDGVTRCPSRSSRLEQGINSYRAGKPIGRSLTGRLRATPLDLHCPSPLLLRADVTARARLASVMDAMRVACFLFSRARGHVGSSGTSRAPRPLPIRTDHRRHARRGACRRVV